MSDLITQDPLWLPTMYSSEVVTSPVSTMAWSKLFFITKEENSTHDKSVIDISGVVDNHRRAA